MSLHGIGLILLAVLTGTASVVLATALARWWDRRSGRARPRLPQGLESSLKPMVLLFRDQALVDATPPARALLDRFSAPEGDWARLLQWIGPRFPDAINALGGIDRSGRFESLGQTGAGSAALRLVVEQIDPGLLRITITDPQAEYAGIVVDSMSQQAMEEELDLLRRSLDQTPMLVWRQDAEERVTWANAAYLRRAEGQSDEPIGWPLPRLLDAPRPVPGSGTRTRRASLNQNGAVSWYDCHSHQTGEQTMMFALPADAAVRAERSLREFVQTLTKTFADLPIGLAIFDRQRQLQLFNPALIDLTNLPTGFLTARPTLFDLLDKLRELRMVPEPKDFRSWRQQMSNLESAAATGHHVEEWSLPGGQTYRVTGRPHPDGAVAFLFEDITSEMSLTRKFRAEMALGNSILDNIGEAVVVFGPGGRVAMANGVYRDLWPGAPDDLGGALACWQSRAEGGPGLDALGARLGGAEGTLRDSGLIVGPGGRLLGWTVTRLPAGRQMVRFRLPDPATQADPAGQRPLAATAAR
ncbi:PAS domain-containing protein [Paracoccus sediminis]|uniref:PAS domain-containing protein n=1 Tax=Paracoccus sediminis TaxID=1214787 RepID=A0A238VEB5_9RHOB|nr:PAS-domain containing protein [Paracoccus sediminis]TBN51990.1 PAS domain-containing protein [Paracoccus sediminis]SNR32735.1 PAS domain-containing protein [Paracoccus sediminis]